MKKRTIILSLVFITLLASSIGFAAAKDPYAKRRFDLRDEIQPLAPPGGEKEKPSKVPVICEIVAPCDGSTISQGTTRGLGSASAKAGVSRVEVNVVGSEATVYVGERPPQRWALLIGIADYRGLRNDLWHPDEDALEMKAELLEYGYPARAQADSQPQLYDNYTDEYGI